MAKQLVTRDRFRIIAETSAEAMGPLLAQLARMGLDNISYELITDVRSFHQNGERRQHDITGADFAEAFVKANPTFKISELVAHFKTEDRTSGSAYTSVRVLLEKGVLVKLGDGNYQSSAVKAIAPPKAAKKGEKATRAANPVQRYETPNKDLILKYMRGRKKVSVKALGQMLVEHGRNGSSASPIVTSLLKAKVLKNITPGEYEVLGMPAPAPGKKTVSNLTPAQERKRERDRAHANARRARERVAKMNGNDKQQSQAETSNG